MATPKWGTLEMDGNDAASTIDTMFNQAMLELDDHAKYKSGTLAARPSAASNPTGTYYYATDTDALYLSNGAAWKEIQIGPIVSADITDGTIVTADLADGAVSAAKTDTALAEDLAINTGGVVRRAEQYDATQRSIVTAGNNVFTDPGGISIDFTVPTGGGWAEVFVRADHYFVSSGGNAVSSRIAIDGTGYPMTFNGTSAPDAWFTVYGQISIYLAAGAHTLTAQHSSNGGQSYVDERRLFVKVDAA